MILRAIAFGIAVLAAGPCLAAEKFRDCPECPEMVEIPAGTFTLGSPTTEGKVQSNESPQRKVTIAHAFAVGIYDITFEQWEACVFDSGCNGHWPRDQGWGRSNRPVIDVSWDDAQTYLRWLNGKLRALRKDTTEPETPGPYRLLTEAEWEYAARAGTTTAYYWGETRGVGNANCDGCGSEWDNKETSPVGSFPPNPFGLYDMAGNVLQWVEDCYHDNYLRSPVDGSAWVSGGCNARVLRGGSWYNSTYYLRSANRYSNAPYFRGVNVGFRVARSLE